MIHAVIPVKSLSQGKSRLAHLLSLSERQRLIGWLLEHLLTVLQQAPAITAVWVVTHDEAVLSLAERLGVRTVREAGVAGMNTAVSLGTQAAIAHGATATLILPADLPYLQVADVEALIAKQTASAEPQLIINGDDIRQGTNALLLSPPQPFTFHYGLNSFAAHLAEGQRRGYMCQIVKRMGIAFDLDTESDWRQFDNERCTHL